MFTEAKSSYIKFRIGLLALCLAAFLLSSMGGSSAAVSPSQAAGERTLLSVRNLSTSRPDEAFYVPLKTTREMAGWFSVGSGIGTASRQILASAVNSEGILFVGGGNSQSYARLDKWDGSSWSGVGGGIHQGYYPTIKALTFDSMDNLYVGGQFEAAGEIATSNVARWDGTNWWALGSGMNDDVYAMAVDSSGNLYAGGEFTEVGGVSANWIAKWDGTSWSSLGDGIRGESYGPSVLALATDSEGNLYAGGRFTTAGGVVANNIAMWDGNTWSALGDGMDGPVDALAIDSEGNLYAGGRFSSASGAIANKIAMWDGSSWSALGSGMDGSEYEDIRVLALAQDGAGNLYAGGNFTIAGGASANYIAMWDGIKWWALGNGIGGTISSKYPVYDYPIVNALVFDGAWGIYTGGGFKTAGVVASNNIALWLNLPYNVLLPLISK